MDKTLIYLESGIYGKGWTITTSKGLEKHFIRVRKCIKFETTLNMLVYYTI